MIEFDAEPVVDLSDIRYQPGANGEFQLLVERFSIRRGQAIAIVGHSGIGKSTFLNILALAVRPDAIGRFVLRSRSKQTLDIGALWQANDDEKLSEARCLCIGYVLQQGGLLPYLSVRQNVELALTIQRRPSRQRVSEIAAQLSISDFLDRRPQTLSTGQRQRVAIARALAHAPDLLLADEPTASVHPSLADEILALMVEQTHRTGAALVLVTHDEARAAKYGFDIVRLTSVAGEGRGRSLLTQPNIEPAAATA